MKQIVEKASAYLGELIDKRDDLNVKKKLIKKKLKDMENLREGERVTPSFFRRMKSAHKQEEIFSLMEDEEEGMETQKTLGK